MSCTRVSRAVVLVILTLLMSSVVPAQSIRDRSELIAIPQAAWSRGIGEPLAGAGRSKVSYPIIDDGYWQGAPIGGFGAGTIGRTYRGDFARYHLKAGIHKYQTVPVNQFSIYQKSEGDDGGMAQAMWSGKPADGSLSAWQWEYPEGAGSYRALYPKSWFMYRAARFPVELDCEQFSPILPHNYRETSYPVGIYKWQALNPTGRRVTISIMLSWANMVGWFDDDTSGITPGKNAGNFNFPFSERLGRGAPVTIEGMVFDRKREGTVRSEGDGQFAIAALRENGVEFSYFSTFNPAGTGAEVWQPFSGSGRLPNTSSPFVAGANDQIAGAIAITFTLAPYERRTVPFAIAWDLPITRFGSGAEWYRRYTAYFGTGGTHARDIAATALRNYHDWEREIDRWQAPILLDPAKPDWYKGMLFNELYDLADGGSLWENGQVGSAVPSRNGFTYLECFDYAYYSTLDVRFYGSFPLAMFWPELEKGEMRAFADTVPLAMNDPVQIGADHTWTVRKVASSLPHDLGAPWESPWLRPNAYNWQNVNIWKDLNPKFVLLVYRDYVLSGKNDTEFLSYCWPGIKEALEFIRAFDRDGDGLPENDGVPDQTYDTWKMKGPSAYCGGLWLAALKAAAAIAEILGDGESAARYSLWLTQGQASLERVLWNGEYYDYDTAGAYTGNIMADQLAGQWYANVCGLGEIVPREHALSALRKIYAFNVLRFAGGEMGAVNGMNPDGSLVPDNEQSEEVWTGTTLGLASFMLQMGMRDEAYRTARGIYQVNWERKGYWFRTPEAWDITGNFRASMYMRPQVIWAMELGGQTKQLPN